MRELLSLAGHTPNDGGGQRWFERDEGAERLDQDRELIHRDYPDLKYGLSHRQRRVFLDGIITLLAECGIPTRVKTRVVFPDDYPEQEPVAFETGDLFPHIDDRHFYQSGACCLWLPAESQWRPKGPDGLHKFLDQVAAFFERQLIYDASPDKVWAWGARGHGIKGYIEFVQEALDGDALLVGKFAGLLSGRETVESTSPCPCGRGKKFKHCHAKRLAKVMERLGKDNPFART